MFFVWIYDINKPVSRKIFFLCKKKQKRYRVRNRWEPYIDHM
nr:MAG TPA: hypothetical protein [Caudoviricetes sp.]